MTALTASWFFAVLHLSEMLTAARQIAVEATSPQPPEAADAATGRDEKKSGADAVDADNLTEIFDRLSQTPKTR
jgi:ABC-type amino acid transport substrate-binding protein